MVTGASGVAIWLDISDGCRQTRSSGGSSGPNDDDEGSSLASSSGSSVTNARLLTVTGPVGAPPAAEHRRNASTMEEWSNHPMSTRGSL